MKLDIKDYEKNSDYKITENDYITDEMLEGLVEKYPDDYQYERAQRFGCGTSSIGDALRRLKITVKKRP